MQVTGLLYTCAGAHQTAFRSKGKGTCPPAGMCPYPGFSGSHTHCMPGAVGEPVGSGPDSQLQELILHHNGTSNAGRRASHRGPDKCACMCQIYLRSCACDRAEFKVALV